LACFPGDTVEQAQVAVAAGEDAGDGLAGELVAEIPSGGGAVIGDRFDSRINVGHSLRPKIANAVERK